MTDPEEGDCHKGQGSESPKASWDHGKSREQQLFCRKSVVGNIHSWMGLDNPQCCHMG